MPLKVGLIGYPVAHSLSPAFQQVAFDRLGIAARYELWSTTAEEMVERVEGLRRAGYLGANVTVPHKQRAFALVDETSERARRAGAVNTIVNRAGRLYGDNTDIPGFLAPLYDRRLSLDVTEVVVLGAGGAARGVVVALLLAGCPRITIANRTPERAVALAEDLGGPIEVVPLDDRLADRLASAGLLVNATAIGWQDDQLPVPVSALDRLSVGALVYDLTYRDTALLRSAARAGYQTLDGLEMLVYQGVESFRLWTGQEPPIAAMLVAARVARAAHA